MAKWKKFVEDNTIDNYIKVEVHTTYYQDGWYTHPGFYFTTKVLRNDLAGVSARLTPVTSEGYQYNNFEADLSLSDLTYNTSESKIKYWTHLDYSGFWNYYNPQLRIYSITTKDGRTITEDSANGVPEEVTLYINNECEDTEYAMIKALIKSDYPSRADYTAEFINKKLKEIDPLCFEMFSKLENAGIGLSPQFEANEADEDCAVDTVATEDYSYDYNFGY